MKFAFDVAPLADLADPLTLVRLAEAAEAAGWDGFSTWDTLGLAMDTVAADPFVALAGRRGGDRAAGAARVGDRPAAAPPAARRPGRGDPRPAERRATRAGRRRRRRRARLHGVRRGLGRRRCGSRKMDEAVRVVDAFLRGETRDQRGPRLPGRRRGDRAAAGPAAAAADLDGRHPPGRHPAGRAMGRLDRDQRRRRRRLARDVARRPRRARIELARGDATGGGPRRRAVRRRGVRADGPGRLQAGGLRGRRRHLVARVRDAASSGSVADVARDRSRPGRRADG